MPVETQTPSLPTSTTIARTDTAVMASRGGATEQMPVHLLGNQTHDIAIARRITTGQSIPHNTATELGLNDERLDTAAMFAPSGTQNRFTAPKSGWYRSTLNLRFDDSSAGRRIVSLLRIAGGSTTLFQWVVIPDSIGVTIGSFSWDDVFLAGEAASWTVTQTSGGALNVQIGAQASFQFLHA